MFKVDELTGDITLRQGDSGKYTITGIEVDYAYTPYLAVTTENRVQVGEQIVGVIDGTSVSFKFKPSFTDLLTVKKGEDDETYLFFIKFVSGVDDIEDTIVIGNKSIYDVNTITVLPKFVEG